jgi:hypothetical protein
MATTAADPGTRRDLRTAAPVSRRRARFVVPLAAALVVVVLAELVVRAGASHLPEPQVWNAPEAQVKYDQMKLLNRAHQTGGVVLLGTSLMDVGVDPGLFATQLGRRVPVYDASLAGGTLESVRWWYTHVVVPLLHPKTVIFGFTSRELNPNDPDGLKLEAQFFASPAVHHLAGTESVMEGLEWAGDDVSYLFRYRKLLRRPSETLHHRTTLDIQRPVISAGGQATSFVASTYNRSPLIPAFFRKTVTYRFAVGLSRVAAVLATLHDIRVSGASVLLVDMPITSDYIALHPNGWADWATYERAVTSIVSQTGVAEMPAQLWTPAYFADPIHLNGAGAKRLTALLAARIRGTLPPRAPG